MDFSVSFNPKKALFCRLKPSKVCFRNHSCEKLAVDGSVDYCPIYLHAKFTQRKKGSVRVNPVILSPSKYAKRCDH